VQVHHAHDCAIPANHPPHTALGDHRRGRRRPFRGRKPAGTTKNSRSSCTTHDRDITYSGCGLPYYVGGQVADPDELHPRGPARFAKCYNMDIRTGHEVLEPVGADPS
jgi:hypothetical protein